jgi:hypothetical protein
MYFALQHVQFCPNDAWVCEPVSATNRTGLRHAETEIGKWRAETAA